MKRLVAGFLVLAASALLAGCYYDPGYSYVRGSSAAGDAYYGASTPVYEGSYYDPGYSVGYGGYGGYGCCYGSGVTVGISNGWAGRGDYRYDDDYRRQYRSHDGGWYGRSDRDGRNGRRYDHGHRDERRRGYDTGRERGRSHSNWHSRGSGVQAAGRPPPTSTRPVARPQPYRQPARSTEQDSRHPGRAPLRQ